MNRTEQLVADLEYLQAAGLTTDQLRSLHHWSNRPEAAKRVTFSTALNYFEKNQDMKSNNAVIADRIRFLVDRHQRGLAGLVEEALRRFPI